MDQNISEKKGPVEEGVDRNLSYLVEGVVVFDAFDESSLGGRASISGESEISREMVKDSRFDKELKGFEEVKGQDKHDQENIRDNKLLGVDQGTSYNSNYSINRELIDTEVVSIQVKYVHENHRKLEAKADESRLSLVSMKAPEGVSETDKNSCVIDIKCRCEKVYENSKDERICRICHLTSLQPSNETTLGTASSATSADLIHLGCACKDELGIAHVHCAEAWFKLKGNRLCEICGETAKNVSVANYEFMEKWNERRLMDDGSNSSSRFGGFWRGQSFCNFLMACLVIAFVLPWFFRVNLF